MDKLAELKKRIEDIQTKSLVASDMKAFVQLVLSVVNKSKEELANLSQENIKVIRDSIAYIEANYTKWDNTLNSKINTATGQFEADLTLLKALIAKVKTIKPVDGVDGQNGLDGKNGIDGKDGSPDTRLQIVEKINTGKKNDLKIEAKQIEGFEKLTTKDNLDRAISILDQRSQFLINKVSNLADRDALDPSTYVPFTPNASSTNVDLGLHNLTVDTNTLFVDSVNHRVGIGTTAPAVKLHVHDASNGTLKLTNDASGITANDGLSVIYNGTGAQFWLYEALPMIFATSGAEAMRILSGGNVGIGTTAPSTKLDVAGRITASGSFATTITSLTNTDLNDGNGLFVKGGGVNAGKYALALQSGAGADLVRVLATGNVGIGTTGPTAKLDILDTTLAGSGSLAGNALKISQTWNTTGVPTALVVDVTNTASGVGSMLTDWRVGGVSKMSITYPSSVPRLNIGAHSITANTALTIFGNQTMALQTNKNSSGSYFTLTNVFGSITATGAGNYNLIDITQGFSPASGAGVYNHMLLAPTIDQSGGSTGITRGIYINPTLTAAADFRALEITAGKVLVPTVTHSALTVATLPTGVAGTTAYITDGDAGLAWGATAVNTGAGATKYLVWFNGANWTVAGK